jgi:hypothetical protein
MSPVETYCVAITHVLAWPSIRYWMVYRQVQWKAGPTGKALFNKARSLALLLVISLVGYWWPFPGYLYLYAAGLTYLTVAVWYQYRVMRRLVKHRAEREEILAHYTVHPKGEDHEPSSAV